MANIKAVDPIMALDVKEFCERRIEKKRDVDKELGKYIREYVEFHGGSGRILIIDADYGIREDNKKPA